MDVRYREPGLNAERVLGYAERARSEGVRLAVFPECVLTGYCFDSAESARESALSVASPEVSRLAAASGELGIALSVGTVWEDAGGRLRNAVLTFDRGELIDEYYKVHLPFMGVDRYVESGDRIHDPIDVDGVRVGIHICYEGGFPEVSRCLTLAGADVIVLPTNWPPGSGVSCRVIPSCRALENRVYFMSVNRVGSEGSFTFIGNSSWSDPSGAERGRLDSDGEGMLEIEVDVEFARKKRLVIEPGVYEVDRIADRHPQLYGTIAE